MITEQQDAEISRRAAARQDKKNPFLINVDDARLIPNVEKLRKHPKYRVYTGPVKAPLAERKAWLESMGGGRRMVLDSSADLPPFDIGKASVEDMLHFAASEYGVALDANMHHNKMRKELRTLAELHGQIAPNGIKPEGEDLS